MGEPLVAALDGLPSAIEEVIDQESALADRLGQPGANRDEQALDRLASLADLTFRAESRPEPSWLVGAGLSSAQRTLDELQGPLAGYQRTRAQLLASYRPAVFELDAAALRSRFADQYTSALSKLSAGYRRDAKTIKACRKDGKLPDDPASELRDVETAQELRGAIDHRASSMEQALGRYARGVETDAEAIKAALQVAREALELRSSNSDMARLAPALCHGSSPDPLIAHLADRLRSSVGTVKRLLDAVQPFVDRPTSLFGQGTDQLRTSLAQIETPIRRLLAAIDSLQAPAAAPAESIDLVRERARAVDEVHRARAVLTAGEAVWRERLGRLFDGPRTDWDAVRDAAAWMRTVGGLTATVTPEIREQALSAGAGVGAEALTEARNQATSAIDNLVARFDDGRRDELHSRLTSSPFTSVSAHCAQMADRIDELRDWTQWRGWASRADAEGWGEFLERLVDAQLAERQVLPCFQRAYWNRRLDALFEEEPELAEDLRGGAFQRWVDEFRILDVDFVRTGPDRLIAQREAKRTCHVSAPGSEVDLLRREAMKARRHLPVRTLLERIPSLLSDLKPCLMMSPLTVSHFLSPDSCFDLVVFDEASQVPPQDAINCVYRGKQLVVAGDSNQLPPTPFFQIAELDELDPEEEDQRTEEDMESVLDACSALLPDHSLRWHYRSRSESLISFSNDEIYHGDLVTFPSALQTQKAVNFRHVPNGLYERGKSARNRPEAAVVAQRVIDFLTDGKERSVGVIAFNSSQASAVAEELDVLRAKRPDLDDRFAGDRLDAVFVKHLEAVQGDERDVILLSVGYGRDAAGRFLMNFGPLNKEGGRRRLNVAVTRARDEVEVIASVRSQDFSLSDDASAGSRMLRDYIAYAEARHATSSPDDPADLADRFAALEGQVATEIRELGYEVDPNVGVGTFRIDLGVRAPGTESYLMGVECDGEGYATTPTARDRERLRHEVLAGLGWGEIHRIWSLDWVGNRLGEVARLQSALSAAEERASSSIITPPAQSADDPPHEEGARTRLDRPVAELGDPDAVAVLPWTSVYERAELGTAHSLYDFHETVNRAQQTAVLIELLEVEAPVSIDYAIGRLAETWGLKRAGHRVVAAGRQSISQAVRRGAAEIRGEFLWKPGQELALVRIPDPDEPDSRRRIEDIPPEEIELAIRRLRDAARGVPSDQLVAQVARVFGFDRTGDRIRSAIEGCLRSA